MRAPFGVSPSALARYFFHDCERFLCFRSTRNPAEKGVPQRREDSGPVMEAVFASGQTWEEQVISTHLAVRVRIAPGEGALSNRTWTVDDSVEQLRSAQPGEFLYQLTLQAPSSLYAALGLDLNQVEIRDNRPDLVEVFPPADGVRRFRVIDIKRGSSVRLPYRIQVLFYALELDHILREHRIEGEVDLREGAAWLGGAAAPEVFDLTAVRPHLEELLGRLPELFSRPSDEADWHLRFRCEWCEYLDYCREQVVANNDVSRLAGLSAHGKRFLVRELGARTLPELMTALQAPDVDAKLERCASLAGERPRLEARLAAYARQEPRPFGSLHPALPRGENIAVFLTVQVEPVGDRSWLLGMLVQAREELRRELFQEEGKAQPFVVLARQPGDCSDVRARFVRRLYQVLLRVDLWNRRQTEWKDKLSLQLYCYSEQERERIIRLLMEALYETELSEQAMALLFHLQAPDLMQVDDHPREILPHPVIPLVSALGRLLALPVDVSYTLPESLAALGSNFEYRRQERFHYPFGHGMRSDDVMRAWNGEEVDLQRVLREGAMRLYAYRAVLQALRDRAGEQLVTWPPGHKLMASAGIRHPRLSRLVFLARYESVLSCLSIRAARCESRELMASKGKLVPMVHEGNGRFRIEAPGTILEASGFPCWLVVRDSPEGLRAQPRFNDWAYRGQFSGGHPDPEVGIGRIAHVDEDDLGFAHRVQVIWDRLHEPALEDAARVLLMPRFLDFNTDKLLTSLSRIDGQGGLFRMLLDDPAAAAEVIELPPVIEAVLASEGPSLGLTPSQVVARDTIARHRVTTVWGPPGTGKTHFLASLILGMAEAYRQVGRKFRVLVTAMTHAAIENLICKLVQRAKELGLVAPRIAKVDLWQSDVECSVGKIDKNRVDAWLQERDVAVLGSTVWGLTKSEKLFDLVIIDEASAGKGP